MIPHIDDAARELLAWFDASRRDLPWRRDTDPYRVWVSEVMLQQTRVETVVPRFERWVNRFPTLSALAGSDVDDVLGEWEGLGYYSRARNLHAAALVVRDSLGGQIPGTAAGLRVLPGVGEYTAGAVASIAFGRPEPAIDVNARRVLSRLFDLPSPGAALLRERAAAMLTPERPGDFNQALIELGATVCRARGPRCAECPLAGRCLARARGTIAECPGNGRRPAVPAFEIGVAAVTSPAGRALLVRRAESGMLGGMWEFPGRVVEPGERAGAAAARAAALAPGATLVRPLADVDQAYSHRRHRYHAFLFEAPADAPVDLAALAAGGWTAAAWELPDPAGRALPAAQRKIARALAALAPC